MERSKGQAGQHKRGVQVIEPVLRAPVHHQNTSTSRPQPSKSLKADVQASEGGMGTLPGWRGEPANKRQRLDDLPAIPQHPLAPPEVNPLFNSP